MAFTPTVASKEQERVFVPTPGQMPNSNFNSELNYPMGYPRNNQPHPPYQQNMEHQHQHPSVPVTYQNSLNYLQNIARDRSEGDQKVCQIHYSTTQLLIQLCVSTSTSLYINSIELLKFS